MSEPRSWRGVARDEGHGTHQQTAFKLSSSVYILFAEDLSSSHARRREMLAVVECLR